MKKFSDLIDTNEAAQILGVTPKRVRDFCNATPPRLRHQRIAQTFVFARSDVQQFKRKKRIHGRPKSNGDNGI